MNIDSESRLDKTQNNEMLWEDTALQLCDPDTVEYIIQNILQRVENYTSARDTELTHIDIFRPDFQAAAQYDSKRDAMDVLYNDLKAFQNRIYNSRDRNNAE